MSTAEKGIMNLANCSQFEHCMLGTAIDVAQSMLKFFTDVSLLVANLCTPGAQYIKRGVLWFIKKNLAPFRSNLFLVQKGSGRQKLKQIFLMKPWEENVN